MGSGDHATMKFSAKNIENKLGKVDVVYFEEKDP